MFFWGLETFYHCLFDQKQKQFLANRTISYERKLFPDDFAGNNDGGTEYEKTCFVSMH